MCPAWSGALAPPAAQLRLGGLRPFLHFAGPGSGSALGLARTAGKVPPKHLGRAHDPQRWPGEWLQEQGWLRARGCRLRPLALRPPRCLAGVRCLAGAHRLARVPSVQPQL